MVLVGLTRAEPSLLLGFAGRWIGGGGSMRTRLT